MHDPNDLQRLPDYSDGPEHSGRALIIFLIVLALIGGGIWLGSAKGMTGNSVTDHVQLPAKARMAGPAAPAQWPWRGRHVRRPVAGMANHHAATAARSSGAITPN